MSKELWCKATHWIITATVLQLPWDTDTTGNACISSSSILALICRTNSMETSMSVHVPVQVVLHSFTEWTHPILTVSLALSPDWTAAGCQSSAAILWGPTPPVWESWTWVTASCRIQWWCCSLIFFWIHSVNWGLSGQFTYRYSLLFCRRWEGIRSVLVVGNK